LPWHASSWARGYKRDAELGDDDEFYKREAQLRQRTQEVAQEGNSAGSLMLKMGTKKRKRKPVVEATGAPNTSSRKKSRNNKNNNGNGDEDGVAGGRVSTPPASSHLSSSPAPQPRRPRPRPLAPPTSDRPSSPLTLDNTSPSPVYKSRESSMTVDDRHSSTSLHSDLDDDTAPRSVNLSDTQDEASNRLLEEDGQPNALSEGDDSGGEDVHLTMQVVSRRRQVILSDSD